MKFLIIKDLKSNTRSMAFVLAMYAVFNFASSVTAYAYLITGMFLFAMQTAYLEERNQTLTLVKTLPLKSSTFILSKYLSTFFVAIFYLIVGIIVFSVIQHKNPAEFIIGMSIMLVVMGIFFMFFFYKGYQKSYQISTLLFIIIFFLIIFPDFTPGFQFVNRNFLKLSGWQFAIVELIIIGTYFLTSFFAVNFFKSREI